MVSLVSGDGDFRRLIDIIGSKGVRVEVVSFRQSTSADLIAVADTYVDLTKHLTDLCVPAEGEFKPRITISADPDKKLLIVEDNGIGMGRDEMAEALGTIARSGTRAFLESMEAAKSGELFPLDRLRRSGPSGPGPARDSTSTGPDVSTSRRGATRTRRRDA